MPGVPSGRGCDGCRVQKKKCDQAKPSCSRCSRLNIACVGAGQQRYKFKEHHVSRNNIVVVHSTKEDSRFNIIGAMKVIPLPPSNELALMTNAFVSTISVSTDLRFNLAWWYGIFLEDIPKRLGINKALDASVMALTETHLDFCSRRPPTPKALLRYSIALRTLRFYLDEPANACTTETLCAVMVLLICQGFIGNTGFRWTGHCEGAAQILKARKYYDPNDEFESKLFISIRAPVIFEGLFNPSIKFTRSEWKTIAKTDLHKGTFESNIMGYVSQVASIIQHGSLRGKKYYDTRPVDELKASYHALKDSLGKFPEYLAAADPLQHDKKDSELTPDIQVFCILQRKYSFGLIVATIMGCVLSAFNTDDTEISSDMEYFSLELITLAESAKRFRPLGSSYMRLCLGAAWIGTSDHLARSMAEKLLVEYMEDFETGYSLEKMIPEFERMSRHLRLIDPYIPE